MIEGLLSRAEEILLSTEERSGISPVDEDTDAAYILRTGDLEQLTSGLASLVSVKLDSRRSSDELETAIYLMMITEGVFIARSDEMGIVKVPRKVLVHLTAMMLGAVSGICTDMGVFEGVVTAETALIISMLANLGGDGHSAFESLCTKCPLSKAKAGELDRNEVQKSTVEAASSDEDDAI